VRSEALLSCREFGVALAEARIACEALERSSCWEETWRARALLARVQGAWGMTARETLDMQSAADVIRRLEGTIDDPRRARMFLADVERHAVLFPLRSSDAARLRRGPTPDLVTDRLTGRVDTEDLVEALISARAAAESASARLDRSAALLREGSRRRRLLERAARAAAADPPSPDELTLVLEAAARACGSPNACLVLADGERMSVRARWGAGLDEATAIERAREAVETGRVVQPAPAPSRRRSDRAPADLRDLAVPLCRGSVRAALVTCDLPNGRPPSKSVLRALHLTADLLSVALASMQRTEESMLAGLAGDRRSQAG
jgi:hypothetical protein